MYEYKMVQIPTDLAVKMGKAKNVAAEFMQSVVAEYAVDGWEFYRVDNLTVTEKPGCLAALGGKKEIFNSLSVISFRREKSDG
jgi:hypothetical protein